NPTPSITLFPYTTLFRSDQCMETTKLIAAELGESLDRFETVFQSRFGSAEWLQPYAAEYFNEAPKKGIKKIAVFCPGFSADCLRSEEHTSELQSRFDLVC